MVGESNYTECVVKRKDRPVDIVYKGLLIFFLVISAILAFLSGGLIQFVGFALLIGIGFFTMSIWPKFHVEYEYIFVDGQIDFDAMYSGSTRKHLKRIDMDKIDVVAPEGASELDGYKHLNLKPADYTSRTSDAVHYVIMTKGEKGPEQILFEPDDNFLSFMKKKSPRKVILKK